MKYIYLVILLLSFKAVQAHQPDLSTLMIYEQNEKYILLIKSSLTGFEGEVKYHNKENTYKTLEEFNELLKKYFEKNCFVIINGDSIKFNNVQIQLGHETTLFAELTNVPKQINTFYAGCSMFKDMYNNKCELIVTTKDVPQKQYILNSDNNHEVKLKVENGKWVVEKAYRPFYIVLGIILLLSVIVGVVVSMKKKTLKSILSEA